MTLGPGCWFGIACVGGIYIDQIQQKKLINNLRNSASGFIGDRNTFSKNKIFEES